MTVAPENTVHVIGEADPVLRCSIEELRLNGNGLMWVEFTTDPANGNTVATTTGGVIENEYYLQGSNLAIRDADFRKAGQYQCRTIFLSQVHMSVELLLLGGHLYNRI